MSAHPWKRWIRDARRMRGERPFVMTNLKKSEGLDRIIAFIEAKGGL